VSLSGITWVDIVTALVALYGSALSTATAAVAGYLAYCQWSEKRIGIKVEVFMGVGHGIERVFVEASNRGQTGVVLASKGFVVPGLKQPIRPRWGDSSDFREPYELLLEHRCQWQMAASSLAKRLRSMGVAGQARVIGFYEDQVGRTYKSQPFRFDVDRYGRLPREEVIAVAPKAEPQQVREMIQEILRRDREGKDRLVRAMEEWLGHQSSLGGIQYEGTA
jgi:hypothetical protein